MHTSEAEYSLTAGYVHGWLVAGPRIAPSATAEPPARLDFGGEVREAVRFEAGDERLTWRYTRAAADHLIDVSAWKRSVAALEAWAYCIVASTTAEDVEAVLTAYAPAAVWVNDDLIAAEAEPGPVAGPWVPRRWRYRLPLQAARNTLTVRFGRAAGANSPTAFALALRPSPASESRSPLRLLIPLSLESRWLRDREVFEAAVDTAYLERNVYLRGERVGLVFAEEAADWVRLTARLQTPDGLIFSEAFDVQTGPGRPIQKPMIMADGAYEVLVLPDTRQYHDEKRLRVSKTLPLFLSNQPYAAETTGTPEGRRLDVLKHAATQSGDVLVETAKALLGAWSKLDTRPITAALARAEQQPAAHAAELVGLVALRARFGDNASFPAELRAALDAALPQIDYAPDGVTEGAEIQLLAAEVLAGQLYAEQTFAATGQTGRTHQERAEQAAAAWLRQRGRHEFAGGNDSRLIEAVVVALTPLVALAENDDLAGLASVLLDKIFFELAIGSFQGTYGVARTAAETAGALTGRLDPAAALGWLLWGQGALNHHLAGVISLAVHAEYQLPELIAAIARHKPDGAVLHAAHGAAQTVTYKTPEYLLSSLTAAGPDKPGDQERAWQATLGPDALIFTSQPANLSFSDLHRPNFWRGDLTQPRVAQWRDALIAIYGEPPAGDGLGFTHAHFPLYAFEEHTITEGWAFARVGLAYVALTAKNGLAVQATGDAAYRELRSPGGANVWLCQLGRADTDGTFAEFQERVLNGPLHWDEQGVDWTTARGDALRFGWAESLLVNDEAAEPAGDWLHDNPYTRTARGAAQMDLMLGEQGLRLIFEEAGEAA